MNPSQLLTHFDRISEAPDAIPRLRRSILDLAVRGKLVEQDSRDEPASELLKRIQAKKVRLVKEGKLKRIEQLPIISIDEERCCLPTGWSFARLGAITNIVMGQSPPGNTYNKAGEGVPLINGPVEFSSRPFGKTVVNQYTTEPTNYCENGDLLLCVRGSTTGRTNVASFRGCIGRGVAAVQPMFSDQFVRLCIVSLRQSIIEMGRGIAFPSVSRHQINHIIIPLPPLAEQHRIVAKVDELMALCDRLEASQTERESRRDRLAVAVHASLSNSLFPTPHSTFFINHLPCLTTKLEHVQQLRQTILSLAVRGLLVPQDTNDEPASQLVIRARRVRREAWEASHAAKQRTLDNNPDNHTWKAKYEFPKRASREPALNLPDGWGWVAWREIGTCQNGRAFPSTDYSDFGIRLLRPGNLFADGSVVWTNKNTRFLPERWAKEYPGFIVGESEIVMNLTAQSLKDAFLGRACLTSAGNRCLLNQRIARLTSYATVPRYTLWLLKSALFRNYVDGGLNQGALIQHMFTTQVDGFEFLLPPLAEQQRIVAKVDELMALCDRLETQLTNTQTESRRLLDATLHETLAIAP